MKECLSRLCRKIWVTPEGMKVMVWVWLWLKNTVTLKSAIDVESEKVKEVNLQ